MAADWCTGPFFSVISNGNCNNMSREHFALIAKMRVYRMLYHQVIFHLINKHDLFDLSLVPHSSVLFITVLCVEGSNGLWGNREAAICCRPLELPLGHTENTKLLGCDWWREVWQRTSRGRRRQCSTRMSLSGPSQIRLMSGEAVCCRGHGKPGEKQSLGAANFQHVKDLIFAQAAQKNGTTFPAHFPVGHESFASLPDDPFFLFSQYSCSESY